MAKAIDNDIENQRKRGINIGENEKSIMKWHQKRQ